MQPLSFTAGHKNQKILAEAFLHSKIVSLLTDLFTTEFAEYKLDLSELFISTKSSNNGLNLTLKSSNINFLSWLKSQNLNQILLEKLQSSGTLDETSQLHIFYKIS